MCLADQAARDGFPADMPCIDAGKRRAVSVIRPPEFRRRAVELARQGTTPVSKMATDLGISDSYLRNWMHKADAGEQDSGDRPPAGEKKEPAKRRRRNRQLEQEKRHPAARYASLQRWQSRAR
jgi:transposase